MICTAVTQVPAPGQSDTYPRGKVLLGSKVRSDLHILPGHRVVTEIGLQGVTCQLEVHFFLLATFRAKHPLPQVRVVEMSCLTFTGTTQRKKKEKKERKGGT